MRHSCVIFFFIFIICSSVLARIEFRYSYTGQNVPFLGLVTGNNVNIREKPTLKSRIIKKGNIGDEFFVTKILQGFYQIKLPPLRGYVHSSYIRILEENSELLVKLGEVTGNNVNLRKGPSTSTRSLTKMKLGTEVIVYEQEGEFTEVELKNERSAYIFREYISPKKGCRWSVNADKLNLRNGPGTNYQKIGQLYEGQSVIVLKYADAFARILLSTGKSGWVATRYLTKLEDDKETGMRESILKDFKEENFLQVINLGEEFMKDSAILDREVCSALITSYMSLCNYAKAEHYLELVSKQAPDYYLEHLASFSDKLDSLLGKHMILPVSNVKNMATCDFQLDGIEDYLFLQSDHSGNFVSFYHWEDKFTSTTRTIPLTGSINENYMKALDINNDSVPELLLKNNDGLRSFTLNADYQPVEKFYENICDLCIEDRYTMKRYGIEKKRSFFRFFRESMQNGSDHEYDILTMDLESPLVFPCYQNTEIPQFFIVNRPFGIHLIKWENKQTNIPLILPSHVSRRSIVSAQAFDASQNDVTDLLVIFSGTGVEPTVLKIFKLKDERLSETFSLDISCVAATGGDLDWNGKTDLIIVSPDSSIYVLFDVLQRKK